jgi:hypothetical protein
MKTSFPIQHRVRLILIFVKNVRVWLSPGLRGARKCNRALIAAGSGQQRRLPPFPMLLPPGNVVSFVLQYHPLGWYGDV